MLQGALSLKANAMESDQEVQTKSRLRKALGMVVVGILLGVFFVAATELALEHTATLEFCATSCHEMSYPYEQYRTSAHYSGRSGVRAVCVDCHIPPRYPQRMTLKVYRTVVDIWKHAVDPMDTPEKFQAQRYRMASNEWQRMKAHDSAECRHCHQKMNPEKQSATAREIHKALAAGSTCIDCHKGIVHGEPEPPKAAK
jgi:nitrate/TMAO reductase-like tetraheme cytochrome c subunit